MKKKLTVLVLVMLLALLSVMPVLAQEHALAGGCPDGFELHNVMHHDDHGEHEHHHIGNDKDHNGDGYLCVKHVGKNGNNHVHIDNNVPLV